MQGALDLRLSRATADNRYWPIVFGTSPCLSHRRFLVMRGLMAGAFAITLIADWVLNYGDRLFYLIFLTNLAFLLQTIYLILAFFVTAQAEAAVKNVMEVPVGAAPPTHLPLMVKSMWLTFSIGLPSSWTIMVAFWTVFRDKDDDIDFGTYAVHLVNTMMLTLDWCVSRNAFYLRHIGVPLAFGVSYMAWTIIHDWAMGFPIYAPLDWRHDPLFATIAGVGVNVMVCLFYFCLRGLTRLRDRAGRWEHEWDRHRTAGQVDVAVPPCPVELGRQVE